MWEMFMFCSDGLPQFVKVYLSQCTGVMVGIVITLYVVWKIDIQFYILDNVLYNYICLCGQCFAIV